MKKDVLINIKGTYLYEDGEPDIIELFTTGTYSKKGNKYEISYFESEATGFEGSKTTLQIENDTVTMLRTGDEANAQLIIQNGVRHQCQYGLGFGDLMIGINGHSVRSSLNPKGGDLSFKYSLDINSIMASENEMIINVKERIN